MIKNKTMGNKNKSICCICKKEYKGYGNNAEPLVALGRCCDKCNEVVIAERIERMHQERTD